MQIMPADVSGPILPDGRPAAAFETAVTLQGVVDACVAGLRALDDADAAVSFWSGIAADGFAEARLDLVDRLSGLAAAAGQAARAVDEFATVATPALTQMVAAREQILLLDRAVASDPSSMVLSARADQAWAAWSSSRDRYWGAVNDAERALRSARDPVSDRPLTLRDHTEVFVTTAWREGIAAPAQAAWGLTGEALVDPAQWWANVTGVPVAVRAGAVALVTDPVGVVAETVNADAWAHGHIGEALGTAAALSGPGKFEPLKAFRLQSVDELLAGVRLDLHEEVPRAHTLARHVHVDDEFLQDRLVNGNLNHNQVRVWPTEVSRFHDQPTAEAAITEVLRRNEAKLRAFAAGGQRGALRLQEPIVFPGRSLGFVMTRSDGDFLTREGSGVFVVVRRTDDGDLFIETAFVLLTDPKPTP